MCVASKNILHGIPQLTKAIQVFQRIWSARVTNERAAWELLSLIDQIHNWAITEFRTFVTKHLKPWHKFCDNNYLLDWKSVYDVKPELKQLRTCREGEDLLLPSWAQLLNEQMQRKLQERAKRSLEEAIEEDCSRKDIERRAYEYRCRCSKGKCSGSQETYNIKAYLSHLRKVHRYSKEELDGIREFVEEGDVMIKEVMNAREQLLREGKDLRDGNNKRGFVEEKRLNDGPSEPSLACIAGSSKRLKVS
jgi:Xaa-Pro aminopeptidase